MITQNPAQIQDGKSGVFPAGTERGRTFFGREACIFPPDVVSSGCKSALPSERLSAWRKRRQPLNTILKFPDTSTRAFPILASGHSTHRSAATPRSIPVSQNEKLASYLVPFSFENSMRRVCAPNSKKKAAPDRETRPEPPFIEPSPKSAQISIRGPSARRIRV